MALNLSKGSKFNLKKTDGSSLNNFCVGVNWGMIEKKSTGFLGFGGGNLVKESVDLDASVGLFNSDGTLLDTVYYGRLNAKGVKHSGDDLTGDADGDDGLDNEIITVTLDSLSSDVSDVVVVLNSFSGQDFSKIPFASVRIYEGTPDRVETIHATFDIANSPEFSGSVSMILGIISKRSGSWEFKAVGESTSDKKLQKTLETAKKYL